MPSPRSLLHTRRGNRRLSRSMLMICSAVTSPTADPARGAPWAMVSLAMYSVWISR